MTRVSSCSTFVSSGVEILNQLICQFLSIENVKHVFTLWMEKY